MYTIIHVYGCNDIILICTLWLYLESGPVGTTGEGGFKFVCELFFITSWCLHVGLLPAVNQFTSNSGDLSKQLLASNMPPKLKEINSV